MARSLSSLPREDELLSDDTVERLLDQLTPSHRIFLASLGRGFAPAEAARRAGWKDSEADRIADVYMTSHPIVSRLAVHIVRLRELATIDGEEPVFSTPDTLH